MAWSVFDGTYKGSHEDLFRYARLQTPHGKAVLAGLDWAEDADWYVGHALENGLAPTPEEVLELADWSCGSLPRLIGACKGAFSQEQLFGLLDMADDREAREIVRHAVACGTKLDDAGMCAVFDYCEDKELADALVACRVADRGPYTSRELCPGYDKPSISEHCSHETVEALLKSMKGRFDFDQAMDFMTYHICDDYTDDTLEAVLAVTDCDREEADTLLFGHGYSRQPDPLFSRPGRAPAQPRVGFFDLVGAAFLGKFAWDALHGGSSSQPSAEPAFQDFNHAWGSDNDHNWGADGDMRWDDYSGM